MMAVSNRTCSIEGCSGTSYGRGMCTSHYSRWYRSGSPYPRQRESVTDRLKARLVARPDGCVEWTGSKTPLGYGKMSVGGKQVYVHRLVLEAHVGPLPPGTDVDHKCRNRGCARIDHLQAVTHKQNMENRSPRGQGASGHRGVTWCARTGKWAVKVGHEGRSVWGGRHESLPAAIAAAQALRARLFTNSVDD